MSSSRLREPTLRWLPIVFSRKVSTQERKEYSFSGKEAQKKCSNFTASARHDRSCDSQGTRDKGGGGRNTHRISFQSWRAEAELRRTRTWPHGYEQITVCHSCAQCQWHPPSTGTLDWDPEDSCETKSFRNWQTTLLTQMFQIFIALILPRRNLHAHKLKCNQWRYYEFTQRRGGTKSQVDNKTEATVFGSSSL